MKKLSKATIRRWMLQNAEDHVAWDCLEVNDTTLAEDAWNHLNPAAADEDEIDDLYYQIAVDVASEWEMRKGQEYEADLRAMGIR